MPFWNFRDNDDNGNSILQIDGVLQVEPDWWMMGGAVVARNFRRRLDQTKDVTVYINSPGGDVMAGAEIYTALREHATQGRGRVTVKVSGIAASAASIVAMAGDEILMSPVAYMMIHNPWTDPGPSNARNLRKQADVLDVIGEGLMNAYQLRTGKTRDELAAMLEAETYMSAQTCVDEGFADGLMYETPQQPADPKAKQPTAMMQAKNHNRQAVMAMLVEHGAAATPTNYEPSAMAAETAKRADIAKRAAFVAGLF